MVACTRFKATPSRRYVTYSRLASDFQLAFVSGYLLGLIFRRGHLLSFHLHEGPRGNSCCYSQGHPSALYIWTKALLLHSRSCCSGILARILVFFMCRSGRGALVISPVSAYLSRNHGYWYWMLARVLVLLFVGVGRYSADISGGAWGYLEIEGWCRHVSVRGVRRREDLPQRTHSLGSSRVSCNFIFILLWETVSSHYLSH